MATVVEGDDRLLVLLLRLEGEVDRTADRVTRLRCRDEALGLREDFPRLERAQLVDRPRLDEACIEEDAQRGRGPVVPQPARMDAGRHERVAQRVHLHEGRHLPCVAEVVFVPTLRHRGDGGRLDRDEARVRAPVDPFADRRVREAREVRSAADGTDHEVRGDVGQLELLLGLEADDGLVQEHVVQDGAEGIPCIRTRHGGLNRFRDRDAQGAGMARILGQDLLADVRPIARTRDHLGAVEAHYVLSVRLLVVGDSDHEHLRPHAEVVRGKGERGTPLSRSGLGRIGLDPFLRGEVGLGDRRVRLVRADRREVLALVVNLGRRLEERFQARRAIERRRPTEPIVGLPNFLRDRLGVVRTHLLTDQFLREQRLEGLRRHGLLRPRVQIGRERGRQVRQDVVPGLREVVPIEENLHVARARRCRLDCLHGHHRCLEPESLNVI